MQEWDEQEDSYGSTRSITIELRLLVGGLIASAIVCWLMLVHAH